MKKLLLPLLLVSTLGFSQTRTSVANGNVLNPLTWDCTCIPMPGENIVINHNLIMNTDFAYTSGGITINSGASLIEDATPRNLGVFGGSFTNNGTFKMSRAAFSNSSTTPYMNKGRFTSSILLYIDSNATFDNQGKLYVNDTLGVRGTLMSSDSIVAPLILTDGLWHNNVGSKIVTDSLYNAGVFHNHDFIQVNGDFWNSENFMNHFMMNIGGTFFNGDSANMDATFLNDILISVGGDWLNSDASNGNGRWCIGGQTYNSGAINGSGDYCDANSGGIDFNTGTISSTTTYCATSCNVSIADVVQEKKTAAYPNPTKDILSFSSAGQLTMYDVTGKTVLTKSIKANTSINLNGLNSGIYFYKLINASGETQSGKVIKE